MECFMGLWETQMVNHPVLGYIQCFERNQRLLAVNGLTACGIPTTELDTIFLGWIPTFPYISAHLLLTGPSLGRVFVQIFEGHLPVFPWWNSPGVSWWNASRRTWRPSSRTTCPCAPWTPPGSGRRGAARAGRPAATVRPGGEVIL